MELNNILKAEFCDLCKVPIKVFRQDVFESRIELYDPIFGSKKKLEEFKDFIKDFTNEQDVRQYYNTFKQYMIDCVKKNEGYELFNKLDLKEFKCDNYNLQKKGVFQDKNDGKTLISYDLKSANFSVFKYLDKRFGTEMLKGKQNYDELARMFTDYDVLVNSKYARQVIFGCLNPGRQVEIEKYFIGKIVEKMHDVLGDRVKDVCLSFMSDEVVIDKNESSEELLLMLDEVRDELKKQGFTVKKEEYKLTKVKGVKESYILRKTDGSVDIKCYLASELPFILRALKGEDHLEVDRMLYCDKYLCRMEEIPEIVL